MMVLRSLQPRPARTLSGRLRKPAAQAASPRRRAGRVQGAAKKRAGAARACLCLSPQSSRTPLRGRGTRGPVSRCTAPVLLAMGLRRQAKIVCKCPRPASPRTACVALQVEVEDLGLLPGRARARRQRPPGRTKYFD